MSRTFHYRFTTEEGMAYTNDVTIITEDDPQDFGSIGGQPAGTGYAVTGVSGTFNGKIITQFNGPAGQLNDDSDPEGGVSGPSDNVIFVSDTQGVGGSHFGLDTYGLSFRTEDESGNPTDYTLRSSSPQPEFTYQANGNEYPATFNSSDAPCYCTGTLIATAFGEVAVEDLAIGDRVVTASGEQRPIKWIGTRAYDGRFLRNNPSLLPVRFEAGSLAEGVPARDLWVSPKHAMFLDGCLIPAAALVNGRTITRVERVDSLTYWHVELDSHDVLLAEGAASESFVDDNSRHIFHNADGFSVLYPEAARVEAVYCAPRVEDGYVLEAVRRRLDARAGLAVLPARAFGVLRGAVEGCDGSRVWGWAQDTLYPDGPVCLDVLVDGAVVGMAYADTQRADLAAAGIGDGRHGFSLHLPQALRAGQTLTVRRSADGAALPSANAVEPSEAA